MIRAKFFSSTLFRLSEAPAGFPPLIFFVAQYTLFFVKCK